MCSFFIFDLTHLVPIFPFFQFFRVFSDICGKMQESIEINGSIGMKWVNSLKINFPHHIEHSQLIFIANQFTGFYMMGEIGF